MKRLLFVGLLLGLVSCTSNPKTVATNSATERTWPKIDRLPASTAEQSKLFDLVFIKNGSFPVADTTGKPATVGTYFAKSLYAGLLVEAPTFGCKEQLSSKVCTIQWLAGKYVAANEKQASTLPASFRNLGAPFLQTEDCGYGLYVELKKQKASWVTTKAEVRLEMCGGF